MSQRFTLNRQSFEEFLAAASLVQQLHKERMPQRARANRQPLLELAQIQRSLEKGEIGLAAAGKRTVALAQRVVGASGVAVWLFTNENLVYFCSAGSVNDSDRLRLEVLSRMVATCHPGDSCRDQAAMRIRDAGHYPGSTKSLLVAPIHYSQKFAGVLAACSSQLDAFTERDAKNLRFLAGLLTQALTKTIDAGARENSAVELPAVLEIAEKLTKSIQKLAAKEDHERFPYAASEKIGAEAAAAASDRTAPSLTEAQTVHVVGPEVGTGSQGTELHGISHPKPHGSMDDVYVPGIGVRAALGGDLPAEPSNFWPAFLAICRRATRAVAHLMLAVLRSLAYAGQSLTRTAVVANRKWHEAQYRRKLHAVPARSLHRRLRTGSYAVRQAAEGAFRLCTRAASGLHRSFASSRTQSLGLSNEVQPRQYDLRSNYRLNWPVIPSRALRRQVRYANSIVWNLFQSTQLWLRSSIRPAIKTLFASGDERGRWTRSTWVSDWRTSSAYKLNLKSVRRLGPAWVLLLIILSFLVLEIGLHRSSESAAASSVKPVQQSPPSATLHPTVTANASGLGNEKLRRDSKAPAQPAPAAVTGAVQQTHLQITDKDTEAELPEMTRFEVSKLRKDAQYGDDVAAFQLGMAYEIGYEVPRSCVQAAQWVSRSASAGNAAAQYNLGLRYRDGDGVTADPAAAQQWLREAAAQRYPRAQAALAVLGSAKAEPLLEPR
jgi:hypothetical protein